jgi:hypothetical protein
VFCWFELEVLRCEFGRQGSSPYREGGYDKLNLGYCISEQYGESIHDYIVHGILSMKGFDSPVFNCFIISDVSG